jgi:ABC-type glycerol-3-phosphate transport system substrate-binding protein
MSMRKLWQVLVTLALVSIMSVSVLAVTTLEVVTTQETLAEWYNVQGKKFSALYPDIVVEARTLASANALTDHITVRLAAGDPPDIADTVVRVYYPWADANMLVDMQPYLNESGVLQRILPGLVQSKLYKGKLYSAPTTVDPFLTAFDVRMFAEAGIADPYTMSQQGNWNWETGLAAAKKLTRRTADGVVTQWGWAPGNNSDWSWASYIVANGGSLLSPDNRTVQFNQPKAIEAMDWIAELYNGHGVGKVMYFQGGPLAMGTTGTGGLQARKSAYPDAELSSAPIPAPAPGMQSKGIMFADGPVIFDKGNNKEAALKFIAWLLTEDAQKSLTEITGRVPSNMAAMLRWGELASHLIGGANKAHLWSDVAANAQLMPFGAHYTDMMKVLDSAMRSIMNGTVSAANKMQEIAGQVQAILDGYYGK